MLQRTFTRFRAMLNLFFRISLWPETKRCHSFEIRTSYMHIPLRNWEWKVWFRCSMRLGSLLYIWNLLLEYCENIFTWLQEVPGCWWILENTHKCGFFGKLFQRKYKFKCTLPFMVGYGDYAIRYINPGIVQLNSCENILNWLLERNLYIYIGIN